MALFGSKKKTEKKNEASKEAVKAPAPKSVNIAHAKDVLLRPRITEKAANMTAQNVYTFDIRTDATKKDVALAVKMLYKVTPIKVNVVNVKGKKVAMRRKRGFGVTSATRKALVYLKKGEEIQFA
jgi:large subunit ribosomal protein L23